MGRARQNLINTFTFFGGVVAHHYTSKILDYKNDQVNVEEQAFRDKEMMDVIKQVNKTVSEIKVEQEQLLNHTGKLLDKQVSQEKIDTISGYMDTIKQKSEIVYTILSKGSNNVNFEEYVEAYRAAYDCKKNIRDVDELVKALVDSFNSKSNLVSNFDLNLDFIYGYLNSLGLVELSALFNVIILVLICLICFNILSAVLGNEIIKFFNLEEKFPKLAILFRLRLKFQRYYLI